MTKDWNEYRGSPSIYCVMKMKEFAKYALIAVLVAVAVYVFHGISPFGAASATLTGTAAPEFALPNYAGETVSLAQQRGRIVLLAFWFPTCTYCRSELPHFEKFEKQYGEAGLSVIAVETSGATAAAKQFIRDSGLSYSFVEDAGAKTAEDYKVEQYPTTFLIDREGVVRAHYLGYAPGQENEIEHALQHLLEGTTHSDHD